MCRAHYLAIVAGLFSSMFVAPVRGEQPSPWERYLTDGRLADGQRELTAFLKDHRDDDQAKFALGAIQFVRAIEHLAQSLYQFGALGPTSQLGRQIPFLRVSVPANPEPDKIRYADVRRMLQNLVDDLAAAEKTLAEIKDKSVKLPLHFGLIRLDLNGDGRAVDSEVLWTIYANLNRGVGLNQPSDRQQVEAFVIAFDYGDVHWLRGYCHLLSTLCEAALAYDQQDAFNAVARNLFDKPEMPGLPAEFVRQGDTQWIREAADSIAAIHLARFPIKEPARMKSALAHLENMIEQSRLSWKAIQAETDDDREWIPNGKQTGVIPGVRVTEEMIAGWHEFLAEAEQLLQGKKLVPHWQFNEYHGINLRRVFLEPREFDVVMWAHGAAAIPYTERGACVTRDTWNRMERVFGGQFIGFAFWFN